MLVIALASQKGGSGKTTLSGHLAVEAEKAGAGPVALIDTDPQGSLAAWWNVRVEKTPAFARVGVFDIQSAIQHLERSGIKLVIIDTPPAITDAISHVISQCDLVIVPCRPSPHDLRSVGATADMADRHNKPLIFVVNAGTLRARITGEAAVALSQHGTVAPVTIHHRVDFAASMVDGRTVGEIIPDSPSAREITELWTYIQDRLARLAKDPTLSPEDKPEHLSISSLSPGSAEDALDPNELPAPAPAETYEEKTMAFNAPPASPAPAEPAPTGGIASLTAKVKNAFGSQPAHANPAQPPAYPQPTSSFDAPQSSPADPPPFASEPPPADFTDRKFVKPREVARSSTLFGGERKISTFGRRGTD